MMFELPKLPYAYDALEPYIDAATMEIHYTKHHQAYINNLNAALEKEPALQKYTLEELLTGWDKLPESIKVAVRNHAGGHHNHSLFWTFLKKDNNTSISGKLKELIERDFGSVENFQTQFNEAAKGRFGSGWAWLVVDSKHHLQVISTPNQDSPLMNGLIPIFGLDVWEHAYYLKYQNRRPDYVAQFWNIVDWNVVQDNLQKALHKK
ncbi:MAG: superoxide dismutase [Brevinemataceae bacterium]